MLNAKWIVPVLCLAALAAAGCQKDRKGAASLSVRTTLPDGVPVTLVSVDRPGTYVERVKSDLGGTLSFTGIVPGKYMLVYQFTAPDGIPGHTPYNYGESEAIVVKPGRNRVEWTVDTGSVTVLNP